MQDQIGAIQTKLSENDAKFGALEAAAAERQALQTQVAAIDAALKEWPAASTALRRRPRPPLGPRSRRLRAALDPKIAAIGQRVEQAEQRLEAGRAAPLFAAVQVLAQTFHRGAPFATELTAVEAWAPRRRRSRC